MFPRVYFAGAYFAATYWPGGAEVEAQTLTADSVPDENRVVIGADDNNVVVD